MASSRASDPTSAAPDLQHVSTLGEMLRQHAALDPDRPVLFAPDRTPLTLGQLDQLVTTTVETLRSCGVGAGDRVAVAIESWGPEAASGRFAVAVGASCILVNTASPAEELRAHLEQSKSVAVIVRDGVDAAARDVGRQLGIPVIELASNPDDPAGLFTLRGPDAPAKSARVVRSSDIAYVGMTTGTTARPKLVPYTHGRLVRLLRAGQGMERANLRSMVPAPLHAAPSAFYAMMLAYGRESVFVAGFDPSRVLEWMADLGVNVYAGYEVIHEAVVAAARRHPEVAARCRVERIITPVTPLAAELEEIFGAEVTNAYGMSECLLGVRADGPTAKRKPATVGKPLVDTEVRIADDRGRELEAGRVGEILLRGPNIFEGYLDDPDANAEAFRSGWFRTGDAGYLDEDGDLFITGRLKEQINRGGEKVSPVEVEAVLKQHPAVADAGVFGMHHRTLGEEVAAAVVSTDPAVTEAVLRDFAIERLAPFKVPRRVVFVEAIQRDPGMGKVLRVGMADRLGLGPRAVTPENFEAPVTDVEKGLAAIWRRLLEHEGPVGRRDDFFDMGGDSLLAMEMLVEVEEQFGARLPPSAMLRGSRLCDVAAAIESHHDDAPVSALVSVETKGSKPPLFFVPGGRGGAFTASGLAFHLGSNQPLYAFQIPGIDGKTKALFDIQPLAAEYVAGARQVQPHGPYRIGGHSFGGLVAFEMARQLQESGESVDLLALIEAGVPVFPSGLADVRRKARWAWQQAGVLSGLDWKQRRFWLRRYFASKRPKAPGDPLRPALGISPEFRAAVKVALEGYDPAPYPGGAVFFRATSGFLENEAEQWRTWIHGPIEVVETPGDHESCVKEPNLGILAATLRDRLGHPVPASQAS